MAYTKLTARYSPGAQIEEISAGDSHKVHRLSIPAGTADKYRLAQLDDYTQKSRGQFPLRPPIHLSLSARTSSESIPGTWGFGLWNDPFGLSLGFGGNPFRLPALPNAIWFFSASEESYLSFKTLESRSRLRRDVNENTRHAKSVTYAHQKTAANGFLAQVFRSPKFHPLLILAGLALPFSRRLTRRLLANVIGEEGTDLCRRRFMVPESALENAQSTNFHVTQWHKYRLEWREDHVAFEVDEAPVFESHVSPHSPLGLVIWIDNQYAAFTPEGKIGFGVLENPEPAWMEIKDIEVS